jgi:hypothetical protein
MEESSVAASLEQFRLNVAELKVSITESVVSGACASSSGTDTHHN